MRGVTNALEGSPLAWLLWQQSREGFVIEQRDGTILAASPAFAEMLGYTPSELRAKTWPELTLQHDVAPGLGTIEDLLEGRIRERTLSKLYKHKHGHPVMASTRVTVCPASVADALELPKDSVLVFAQSLTEEPQIRQEITEAQKMAFVKQAVGDIILSNWTKVVAGLLTFIGLVRVDDIAKIVVDLLTK